MLLLHLAQDMYFDSKEEIVITLDLLSRLVSFNTVSWLVSLAIFPHFGSLENYGHCLIIFATAFMAYLWIYGCS